MDDRRLEELNDLPAFSNGTAADTTPHQLSVVGRVRLPRVFTLKELQLLPTVSLTKDFQCLEGWSVKGIAWEGIRVTDVLHHARLTKDARWILFGSGTFTAVIDRETALRDNTILAMKKGGKKLTSAHGGPLK